MFKVHSKQDFPEGSKVVLTSADPQAVAELEIGSEYEVVFERMTPSNDNAAPKDPSEAPPAPDDDEPPELDDDEDDIPA